MDHTIHTHENNSWGTNQIFSLLNHSIQIRQACMPTLITAIHTKLLLLSPASHNIYRSLGVTGCVPTGDRIMPEKR